MTKRHTKNFVKLGVYAAEFVIIVSSLRCLFTVTVVCCLFDGLFVVAVYICECETQKLV